MLAGGVPRRADPNVKVLEVGVVGGVVLRSSRGGGLSPGPWMGRGVKGGSGLRRGGR